MSRKRRQRPRNSDSDAAVPPPPSDDERQTWPARWRELERRLHPGPADALKPADYRKTGPRVWEWGAATDGRSALLSGGSIVWEWKGHNETGDSLRQDLVDFLASGSGQESAPPGVAWELFSTIRERDFERWPRLLAEASALTGEGPSSFSRTSWDWGDKYDRYNAFLTERGVYWSWEGPKDLGGGAEQTFENFLANGPRDPKAPENIVREISAAVAARSGAPVRRPRSPPPATPPASGEAHSTEQTNAPFGRLLLQGLAVFAASAAVALPLATILPTTAKYVSIILPIVLGFAAAWRWGSLALIVSGIFAMAAGLASQHLFERFLELSAGPVATLASIAEAPQHRDATRFIVTDVRAEASVTGRAQRTTTRSFGAGPRDERWVHLVRALVPAGWQRTQPVPAWIACTTSPGFDCLSGLDAKGIVRIRRDEIDHFRPAIADAERRHRVVSAADAPIVEASSDPAAAPWIYLAAVASIQITCFALWLLGVAGARLWQRRRGNPAPV